MNGKIIDKLGEERCCPNTNNQSAWTWAGTKLALLLVLIIGIVKANMPQCKHMELSSFRRNVALIIPLRETVSVARSRATRHQRSDRHLEEWHCQHPELRSPWRWESRASPFRQ